MMLRSSARSLLAVVLVALGCGKHGSDAAATATAADGKEIADAARAAGDLIRGGDVGTGVWSILNAGKADDGADRPDARQRIARVAAVAAPVLVANWDAIAAQEKKYATSRGIDRARGMSRDNCLGCDDLRALIEIVGPGLPALQSKWDALAPELTKVEAAAYDAEANDKRPRVFVLAHEDVDVMALDCTVEALAKKFPSYKFVSSGTAEGAIVRITSAVNKADYRNTSTEERTSLMSGLEVTLTGENLAPALAKQLALPIVARANVDTPDQITGTVPGAGPELEASRVGMAKIEALTATVCGQLAAAIERR